jgi:ferredoxin
MEDRHAGTGTEGAAGDLVTAGSPGRWRITVDSARCIGSGSCAGLAADIFVLNGRTSRPVRPTVSPDRRVLDAAELCPVEAIVVLDAGTGEPVPPAAG